MTKGVRRYVVTTGAAFALLAVAHLARLMLEGFGPLSNPVFVVTTLLAFGMTAWAVSLVVRRGWSAGG